MWYDEIEGEFIRRPKQLYREEAAGQWAAKITHTAAIFKCWSVAELIVIGVYPLILKTKLSDYTYGDESAYKEGDSYIEDTIATIIPIATRVANKKGHIGYRFNAAVNAATAEYPVTERDSWYKQAEEAKGFDSDPSFSTPLLNAMSDNDPQEKAELVTKIMANIDSFAAIVGALLRKKRALIKRLDDGEDPAGVNWE